MFEVGKKVICIKNHSKGLVKKGQVLPLLGIKETCCNVDGKGNEIELNVGIPERRPLSHLRCYGCGKWLINDGYVWLGASLFAPYDDSLSSITVEELLEEVEGTAIALL